MGENERTETEGILKVGQSASLWDWVTTSSQIIYCIMFERERKYWEEIMCDDQPLYGGDTSDADSAVSQCWHPPVEWYIQCNEQTTLVASFWFFFYVRFQVCSQCYFQCNGETTLVESFCSFFSTVARIIFTFCFGAYILLPEMFCMMGWVL